MKSLNNNTYNYFKVIVKGKSKQNLWTTYKEYQTQCKGDGYSKGFISCTSRATNEYKDRTNCAYLCNMYYNHIIKQFFIDKGVSVDEDTWALSELIQWVFRSAIREGNNINIYIPSERMRNLLIEWLNKQFYDFIYSFIKSYMLNPLQLLGFRFSFTILTCKID